MSQSLFLKIFVWVLAGFSAFSLAAQSSHDNTSSIERGEKVFSQREAGHCLLCHQLSINSEPFQGNLGPSLDGVASRLTAAEIRLRIEDSREVNPHTIMPAYYSLDGLTQVAQDYENKTVLSQQQISDLVNYLVEVAK